MCSKRLSWIGSRLSASSGPFVLGWSLGGKGRGRLAGKACALGGWGAWGHGQGEDVLMPPSDPLLHV